MATHCDSKPGEAVFPRLLLFLLSFSLILVYSLAPTVYVGDSGIFTASSYSLGSAHPPGYPLFLLLGKLLTFIPFGNIAFKVNLVCAVFGALTVLLSYMTAFYLTKNYAAGIVASLAVLASPNFILESSKAEVYTLNTFLIVLIFYLGLRALKETDFFRSILISSFILGLGMGNHHIAGFMLIPLLYAVFARRKDIPFGTITLSILLFITGFSVYLYLYIRSHTNTFIDYSQVHSFRDFLTVFFRAEYSGGTLKTIEGTPNYSIGWLYSIKNIGRILSSEVHPVIWLFALIGTASLLKNKKLFGYIFISLVIWLLLAKMTIGQKEPTYHDLFIISPYFLQLIPIAGILAGAGLYKCYEKINARSSLVAQTVALGLIIFQAAYVPVAIQKSSLTEYFTAYNWIKDISKVLKTKSFYFAFGDNPAFLGFYGFGVERLRDDVLYMDAASGNSSFRLILSPRWKFGMWYPEFYETAGTSIKYFYPIAEEGRLYASSIGSLPQFFKNRFDVKGYVIIPILLPKGNKFPLNEQLKENFEKIDYLPIITGDNRDIMTADIRRSYVLTIWEYANLLAAENSKDTDYFYRLAFFIARRGFKDEIIKDYVNFLYDKRGNAAAAKFISELKYAVSDTEMKNDIAVIEKWYRTEFNSRK
ncbi:MAG: DUF2723 domain-containing protein [Nitrospirae bacterium]|nr:DUF2723 domain-containing protein [Nitrospirota bacterium]